MTRSAENVGGLTAAKLAMLEFLESHSPRWHRTPEMRRRSAMLRSMEEVGLVRFSIGTECWSITKVGTDALLAARGDK
jgi:hypothetical protein